MAEAYLNQRKAVLDLKGTTTAFKLAVEDLTHNDPTEGALIVILEDASSKHCAFCGGWGH